MISNNKNKNSRELTLEDIIKKSSFRKNIDSLCALEKKINIDFGNAKNLVQTPVEGFNKQPSEIRLQSFGCKKQYDSNIQRQKSTRNTVTARTSKSSKQVILKTLQNQEAKNAKSLLKSEEINKFKKSKSKANSLERKGAKTKIKKINDYLCVKGDSNNVITFPKPLTADVCNRKMIFEYQIKKYQTLVQLGSEVQNNQKSEQLHPNKQTIASKKHHSFMVTKYSTSNSFRHKAISSKSQSQSKLAQKILLPEELIKKKIQYRAIKTEDRTIENDDHKDKQVKGKIKKYELILTMNDPHRQQKQNNHRIANELNLKGTFQHFETIGQQNPSQQFEAVKDKKQQSLDETRSKGFKGKKVKSGVSCEKLKSRYFIPDFIKPSLDLLLLDKKESQKLRTEEIQPTKQNANTKEIQKINETIQQFQECLARECLNGRRMELNSKQMVQFHHSTHDRDLQLTQSTTLEKQLGQKNEKNNCCDQKGEPENAWNLNKQKKKTKKSKPKMKSIHQGQICGWDESHIFSKETHVPSEHQALYF